MAAAEPSAGTVCEVKSCDCCIADWLRLSAYLEPSPVGGKYAAGCSDHLAAAAADSFRLLQPELVW